VKRKPVLPPTYLLVFILIMVGLHLFLPVKKVVVSPYGYLGVLPLLMGVLLNLWSSNFFNKVKTTVKPFERSSHLITEGLYRYSRNPMYLGMALILLGLALLLGSITPVLVTPVFVWVMARKFIDIEEKALEETFGDDYREYRKRVRRWI